MRFLRSREKFSSDHSIKIQSRIDDRFICNKIHNLCLNLHFLEKALRYLMKNQYQRLFLRFWYIDSIEKSYKPGRKLRSTISSTYYHLNPFDIFKDMTFTIPDSLITKYQPQHLYWRLGSILLNCRHVNVIDEVNELFTRRRN